MRGPIRIAPGQNNLAYAMEHGRPNPDNVARSTTPGTPIELKLDTTRPVTMPSIPTSSEFGMTGYSQSYAPKSSRGGRLGRSVGMSARTEHYGYPGGDGGGTTINFSPTITPSFSNEVLPSLENVSIGGGQAGPTTPRPTTPTTPTTTPRPTTPRAGGGGGHGAREQAVEAARTKLGRIETRTALRSANQTGGKVNARELRNIVEQGAGVRRIRNIAEKQGLTLGSRATEFLNARLSEAGKRAYNPQEASRNQPARTNRSNVSPARPRTGGTLEPFNRFAASITAPRVTGSSQRSRAQAAANIGGLSNKLSAGEAATALSSDITPRRLERMVESGAIRASKRAKALIRAERKQSRNRNR